MRKISELPEDTKLWTYQNPNCLNPEHEPPRHINLEPGIYEHICPSCGNKIIVNIYPNKMSYLSNKQMI